MRLDTNPGRVLASGEKGPSEVNVMAPTPEDGGKKPPKMARLSRGLPLVAPVNGIVQPPFIPAPGKPGRMTNQLKYLQEGVLTAVWNNPFAGPFQQPMDAVKMNLKDYYKVIRRPMDLGTIKKRLEHGFYWSAQQCMEDFRLVFNNCYIYHQPDPSAVAVVVAKSLETVFNEQVAKMPKDELEIENQGVVNGGVDKENIDLVGDPGAKPKKKIISGAATSTQELVASSTKTPAPSKKKKSTPRTGRNPLGNSNKVVLKSTPSKAGKKKKPTQRPSGEQAKEPKKKLNVVAPSSHSIMKRKRGRPKKPLKVKLSTSARKQTAQAKRCSSATTINAIALPPSGITSEQLKDKFSSLRRELTQVIEKCDQDLSAVTQGEERGKKRKKKSRPSTSSDKAKSNLVPKTLATPNNSNKATSTLGSCEPSAKNHKKKKTSILVNKIKGEKSGKKKISHGKKKTSHGKKKTSHRKKKTSLGKKKTSHGKKKTSLGKKKTSHGKSKPKKTPAPPSSVKWVRAVISRPRKVTKPDPKPQDIKKKNSKSGVNPKVEEENVVPMTFDEKCKLVQDIRELYDTGFEMLRLTALIKKCEPEMFEWKGGKGMMSMMSWNFGVMKPSTLRALEAHVIYCHKKLAAKTTGKKTAPPAKNDEEVEKQDKPENTENRSAVAVMATSSTEKLKIKKEKADEWKEQRTGRLSDSSSSSEASASDCSDSEAEKSSSKKRKPLMKGNSLKKGFTHKVVPSSIPLNKAKLPQNKSKPAVLGKNQIQSLGDLALSSPEASPKSNSGVDRDVVNIGMAVDCKPDISTIEINPPSQNSSVAESTDNADVDGGGTTSVNHTAASRPLDVFHGPGQFFGMLRTGSYSPLSPLPACSPLLQKVNDILNPREDPLPEVTPERARLRLEAQEQRREMAVKAAALGDHLHAELLATCEGSTF